MSIYDELFFSSKPSPERNPNSFGIVAKLFGIEVSDLKNCKVLEIACSTGANLQAIAWSYPGSNFVGFDNSEAQISFAKSEAEAMKLENVNFYKQSIEEFLGQNADEFDYIICSGLFSWSKEDVREQILECIKGSLTSNGIAYVNFNSLPGWTSRQKIREKLLAEIDSNLTLERKINEARAILSIEAPEANEISDALIVHELLAENVSAFFHDQVIELCDKHKLQYFADAQFSSERYGPLDKVIRGALITHAKNTVRSEADLAALDSFFLSSVLVPNEDSKGDEFFSPEGRIVKVSNESTQKDLKDLSETWPCAVQNPGIEHGELLELYEKGYVRLYLHAPICALTISDKPEAAPFSRRQAAQGLWASNTRHEYANLGELEARLLTFLDGKRSVKDIADLLEIDIERINQSLYILAEHGFLIR